MRTSAPYDCSRFIYFFIFFAFGLFKKAIYLRRLSIQLIFRTHSLLLAEKRNAFYSSYQVWKKSTFFSSFFEQRQYKKLSGGFSLGWPVAFHMGFVTHPDQFGMFGTLDPNVLHTPKSFGFKELIAELRPFLWFWPKITPVSRYTAFYG